MNKNAKERILFLVKLMHEETDPEHGMTTPEIQSRLEAIGMEAERKTVYRDLEAMRAAGLEIGKTKTRPVGYYLKSRLLEPSQVMLLIDAAQTCKSITDAHSDELVHTLRKLVSKHEAQDLDARIHVGGRIQTQSESIFSALNVIQRAIATKHDISFEYVRYNATKTLQSVAAHDGEKRIKTPLFLVYNNDRYYMLTYDEASADNLRIYRVDRMRNILLLGPSPKDHKPVPGFNIAAYEKQILGMYGGKPESIKLQCSDSLVGSLVDIFGADELTVIEADAEKHTATVRVRTAATPVLFGRIAQFGGNVNILAPKHAVEAYRKHLTACLEAQSENE